MNVIHSARMRVFAAGALAIGAVLVATPARASGQGALGLLSVALELLLMFVVFDVGVGLLLVQPGHRKRFAALTLAALILIGAGFRLPAVALAGSLSPIPILLWMHGRRRGCLIASGIVALLALLVSAWPRAGSWLQWPAALLPFEPLAVVLWTERRRALAIVSLAVPAVLGPAVAFALVSTVGTGPWLLHAALAALMCLPVPVALWRMGWRRAAAASAVALPILILLAGSSLR
jgi:hypothetical protein